MPKIIYFTFLFILLSTCLWGQTEDVYQFESILRDQGITTINPQLLMFKNPAGLAISRDYGLAYWGSFYPSPEMNLITGKWGIFNGGILFREGTRKLYAGIGFGIRNFSIGTSFFRGIGNIDGFEQLNFGFQSDFDKGTIALNIYDINTDHYFDGFSFIETGFSTTALWHRLNLGMEAHISGGDTHVGKDISLAYFARVEVLEYLSIIARYDDFDKHFNLGLDAGYTAGNFLYHLSMNEGFKRSIGNVAGMEVSNRWRTKRFKPSMLWRTYYPGWSWFDVDLESDKMVKMLLATCPETFAFLDDSDYSSVADVRERIRDKYYSRRLKAGELAQGTDAIRAGENNIVSILNIDPSQYPEISLVVSVNDESGNFVSGLTRDDFSFAADTIEILSVEEISSKYQVPVDVVFVIDESGSMDDDIEDLRKNIHQTVVGLKEGGIDFRIGLITYGDQVNRIYEPVEDSDAFDFWLSRDLLGGFREVTENGIAEASNLPFRQSSQKIIILTTDEEVLQDYGDYGPCALLDILYKNNVSLYQAINPYENNAGFISWLTFGQVYNLNDNFSRILSDFQNELVQKYIITYVTMTREEEFKEVRADELPRKKEVKVTISGRVMDPDGHPLSATIVWEDLSTGQKISEIKNAEDSGTYEIEFTEMKNYGYYAESEGCYPISGNMNLKDVTESRRIHQDIILTPIRKLIEEQIGITLNNIFFDFDSSNLRPESYPELNRLAKILKENPDQKVEISGHTDSKGSQDYNFSLSDRRAASVVDYLISVGCDPDNLVSKGYGETKPVATNDTDEGRQMNRRVEFKFIK
ncbi:OmpA family protein [bacterium]|nr:OmpA family protein [bacterium]